MPGRDVSNKVNYEVEITLMLKQRKQVLHYKEINHHFFSKYKTIRNATSYLNFLKGQSECVKVIPGFYAHKDLITKDFYRHLDFERRLINTFIRKELLRKTEVAIDNLVPALFDQQTKNFFSIDGIRYFISNTPNLDDDLKRSYFSSMKKFISKSKSEERQETSSTNPKTTHILKNKLKAKKENNHIHVEYDTLKKKTRKEIFETELSDLNLSVRSSNCLQNENVIQIKDLVKYKEKDLLYIDNFGKTSLREINKIVSSIGLRLGMSDEDIEHFLMQDGTTSTERSPSNTLKMKSPDTSHQWRTLIA